MIQGKNKRLLRVLAVCAVAGSILIAGQSSTVLGAAPAKKVFTAAVLFPGTPNDGSWGQSVAMGANAAAKKYGIKVSLSDNLNTPAQYQQQGSAFASKHYNFVLIANGSDPDVAVKLAKQFPKTMFCETAVTISNKPKNLCTNNGLFQDGDFAAGVLAGLITKTNHVGVIGGFNFPVLNSEMEGFILGARWINHKVKVSETFINTWTDVAAARTAAQAQIGAGADELFSATDQATQGIYAAAQLHPNTYVYSQYFDTHSQAPKVAITSVLLNLNGFTETTLKWAKQGKLKNRNYVFGPKQGVGKLAPFYNLASAVPAAANKRLKTVESWIYSGKLKPPFLGVSGSAVKYNLSKLPAPPK
ncbi:MAG TPA: BMP family ABC transporter substrate-binding protein [Chloroflexota bacterium]|nr:BMP family ABC transporter substrate-binding protein [Chloroflexota bacterium]